jgi:hypothetical protein
MTETFFSPTQLWFNLTSTSPKLRTASKSVIAANLDDPAIQDVVAMAKQFNQSSENDLPSDNPPGQTSIEHRPNLITTSRLSENQPLTITPTMYDYYPGIDQLHIESLRLPTLMSGFIAITQLEPLLQLGMNRRTVLALLAALTVLAGCKLSSSEPGNPTHIIATPETKPPSDALTQRGWSTFSIPEINGQAYANPLHDPTSFFNGANTDKYAAIHIDSGSITPPNNLDGALLAAGALLLADNATVVGVVDDPLLAGVLLIYVANNMYKVIVRQDIIKPELIAKAVTDLAQQQHPFLTIGIRNHQEIVELISRYFAPAPELPPLKGIQPTDTDPSMDPDFQPVENLDQWIQSLPFPPVILEVTLPDFQPLPDWINKLNILTQEEFKEPFHYADLDKMYQEIIKENSVTNILTDEQRAVWEDIHNRAIQAELNGQLKLAQEYNIALELYRVVSFQRNLYMNPELSEQSLDLSLRSGDLLKIAAELIAAMHNAPFTTESGYRNFRSELQELHNAVGSKEFDIQHAIFHRKWFGSKD